MERFFFVVESGSITKTVGYIKNLGLHCPHCHSFIGDKTDCKNCNYRKVDIWAREPSHDVLAPTGGGYFKKKFSPMLSPGEFNELMTKQAGLFIDSLGETYTLEGFKSYLVGCELEEVYAFNNPSLNNEPSSISSNVSDSGGTTTESSSAGGEAQYTRGTIQQYCIS